MERRLRHTESVAELIYEDVFRALHQAKVRYLVVGGVAVVLHGWTRFTKDLDLMLDLDDAGNVRRFVQAAEGLGYRPSVPVALADLADPVRREAWRREKGALVLHLIRPEAPLERIDVFLFNPLAFGGARSRMQVVAIPGVDIPVVSLDDLIAMKEAAGRPQDQEDVLRLKALRYRREKE